MPPTEPSGPSSTRHGRKGTGHQRMGFEGPPVALPAGPRSASRIQGQEDESVGAAVAVAVEELGGPCGISFPHLQRTAGHPQLIQREAHERVGSGEGGGIGNLELGDGPRLGTRPCRVRGTAVSEQGKEEQGERTSGALMRWILAQRAGDQGRRRAPGPSPRQPTAVHGDGVAVHVVRCGRSEEHGRALKVFLRSPPSGGGEAMRNTNRQRWRSG